MQTLNDRSNLTSELYDDPHNPHLHLQRGLIHEKLGFPDLAAADAYRALSLLDSVVHPDECEFHARRKVRDSSPTAEGQKRSEGDDEEEEEEEAEDDDGDDEEGYAPITQDEYNVLIGPVYALLVKSLASCGCLRDAYEFGQRGLRIFDDSDTSSSKAVIENQLSLIEMNYSSSQSVKDSKNIKIDPSSLKAQGFARRVLYPWNTHEPDRKSFETLQLLNERLKTVAPKCEVRAVALPALHSSIASSSLDQKGNPEEVSIQLGLFAKEDIPPGTEILHESSLLTATNRLHDDLCDACNGPLPDLSSENPPVACESCDDTIFCSQSCHDEAQKIYHAAVCGLADGLESIGKDIPDARDKADYLYLLLLGRAIAMAATQEIHPLDLPEVKYIWGDFHDYPSAIAVSPPSLETNGKAGESTTGSETSETLPFSFQLNILQPMRILEEMELDPYSTLPQYDTWVLNTLYAKFRGTASGRLSTWDGGPELCAVHPLWCLANHSCDPNVRWEWGGEITFRVRTKEERAVWGKKKKEQEHDPDDELKRNAEQQQQYEGIKKDQEILNHYCDIGLDVKNRREWARGALGGWCLCERCIWEGGIPSSS